MVVVLRDRRCKGRQNVKAAKKSEGWGGWSWLTSESRLGMRLRAIKPGAARTATWRSCPPRHFLSLWHLAMNSAFPTMTDPILRQCRADGGHRGGEREGRGQQNEAAEAAVVGSRRKWRTHGAPRDLLRQKLTVSKCSPISAGLHPSLAQAFITLAPSRWVGIPLACAISLTLLM